MTGCIYFPRMKPQFQPDQNRKMFPSFWTDTCGCSHGSEWKQMSYSELVKTSVSINRLLLLNVVHQIDRSRSKGGLENGSIMTLNSSGNMSDSTIQVYPSSRSSTCFHGAISSLCTHGHTEAWGNVYHGSVPHGTRAPRKLIYINNHQCAVKVTEPGPACDRDWKAWWMLQMMSDSDTLNTSNSFKGK